MGHGRTRGGHVAELAVEETVVAALLDGHDIGLDECDLPRPAPEAQLEEQGPAA